MQKNDYVYRDVFANDYSYICFISFEKKSPIGLFIFRLNSKYIYNKELRKGKRRKLGDVSEYGSVSQYCHFALVAHSHFSNKYVDSIYVQNVVLYSTIRAK